MRSRLNVTTIVTTIIKGLRAVNELLIVLCKHSLQLSNILNELYIEASTFVNVLQNLFEFSHNFLYFTEKAGWPLSLNNYYLALRSVDKSYYHPFLQLFEENNHGL